MHAQFRLRARYVHGCNSACNLWMPVEERLCSVFMEIGVIVQECGIQGCHCLKDKGLLWSLLTGKIPPPSTLYLRNKKSSRHWILPCWTFLRVLEFCVKMCKILCPITEVFEISAKNQWQNKNCISFLRSVV